MNFSSAKRPMVLVVEDDFLIRMHAAEMITDAGFDVVEAANADAAILILEDRLDVTVVFTDIQMPGSMDGFEIGGGYQGTQATDQDRRHVRPCACSAGRASRGRTFPAEALQHGSSYPSASRIDKPGC